MNDLERFEPMTGQDVAQLIGMAAAVDSRMPQPDPHMLGMWLAAMSRVPLAAGRQAVLDWYRSERFRETRESITPADIAGWWRDRRRHMDAEEARRAQAPLDPELIRTGIDRVFAALAERRAISAGLDPETAIDVADSEAQSRRLMRSVPCPWPPCRAAETKPCVGPKGVPLRNEQVHDGRRQAVLNSATISHP